jgi:hypothetical protein
LASLSFSALVVITSNRVSSFDSISKSCGGKLFLPGDTAINLRTKKPTKFQQSVFVRRTHPISLIEATNIKEPAKKATNQNEQEVSLALILLNEFSPPTPGSGSNR